VIGPIICYGNIIFNFRLFDLRLLFQEQKA
jgi:hypothetical protein